MNIRTPYDFSPKSFFLTRNALPSKRILITADLDEPLFDLRMKGLMEILSHHQIALTLFCTNESRDGKRDYTALKQMTEFARGENLILEIGSHSIRHESLAHKNPWRIVSTIRESVMSFREEGISVCGFRAPYLSTERVYRKVLKEIAAKDGIIKYDSSTSFERNLFSSRIHDFLYWKSPHEVANIWELPISCLDDYHLFTKLKKEEKFVGKYWKRKIDINIRKYNYFLLLIHPEVIGNYFSVLRDFLDYCEQKHPKACFTTCLGLVEELNLLKKKRNSLRNENM